MVMIVIEMVGRNGIMMCISFVVRFVLLVVKLFVIMCIIGFGNSMVRLVIVLR